jgi:hypothetical protein
MKAIRDGGNFRALAAHCASNQHDECSGALFSLTIQKPTDIRRAEGKYVREVSFILAQRNGRRSKNPERQRPNQRTDV